MTFRELGGIGRFELDYTSVSVLGHDLAHPQPFVSPGFRQAGSGKTVVG